MRRYINNQRELFSFAFDGVLPQDCKQDEVWQHPLAIAPGMAHTMTGHDLQVRTETFSATSYRNGCHS